MGGAGRIGARGEPVGVGHAAEGEIMRGEVYHQFGWPESTVSPLCPETSLHTSSREPSISLSWYLSLQCVCAM